MKMYLVCSTIIIRIHGNRIEQVFKSLNYKIFDTVLNSIDFGIPQNRKRLFVVGFKNVGTKFVFPMPYKLEKTTKDFLEKNIA